MKKKILVVVSLLIVVALLTTGAFAYFSSTRTITGSRITAGTLDLKLNNDCGENYYDTAQAWNFEGMAPGGFVQQTICMKNIGSVDAGRVWYDWANLLQTPTGIQLAKKLIIVDAQDNADGGVNQTTAFNSYGIYTLYDLAEFRPGVEGWDAYSGAIYPFLPAHGTAWLMMKFQFDPNAGDEFQGAAVVYDLLIKATQQ
jgi:predicted ribosomally synthesized peptide with SipW-like signal peptide